MADHGNGKVEEQETRPSRSLSVVTHLGLESRAEDIKAGLIDTFLNLDRIDNDLYLARHLLKGRNSVDAVYGGQVVGQSLAAAVATVEERFIPHSLHSYFIKQGTTQQPILYMIDRVRDGRSFCTRIVKAVQNGAAIYSCQISFHLKEDESIVHQDKMPEVLPPEELPEAKEACEELITSKDANVVAKMVLKHILDDVPAAVHRIFEVRPVNPARFTLKEASPEPKSMIWIKARENIGNDHRLHQSVLAYLTDLSMITTSLRPHLRKGFIPSMTFSLDHCLWLHDSEFRVDDWILYETSSPKAHGSRALIEGRLWSRDGRLIASAVQEGLIRQMGSKKKQ